MCQRKRMVDTIGSIPRLQWHILHVPRRLLRKADTTKIVGTAFVGFSNTIVYPTSAFSMHGGVLPSQGSMISKAGQASRASSCWPSASASGFLQPGMHCQIGNSMFLVLGVTSRTWVCLKGLRRPVERFPTSATSKWVLSRRRRRSKESRLP
jgi:hypothetical protein